MIRSRARSARWLGFVIAAACAVALGTTLTAIDAADGDGPGGWVAGDIGFKSTARVPLGSVVEIRIVAMGNSRGIAVTFSGNQDVYLPGKLWARQELREGAVLKYKVGQELANQLLAVRSGAADGGFDQPQKVVAAEGAYRMHFSGGRIIEVSVGAAGDDTSGGWAAGNYGFASKAKVALESVVEIRIVAMGNSRGIAVTFSGNQDAYLPGKLWARQELREGAVLKYKVGQELANQLLAVRSGAADGGFDQPQKVVAAEGAYRMHFSGGRIVDVSVRR